MQILFDTNNTYDVKVICMSKSISVKLPEDFFDRIDTLSANTGLSRCYIVKRCLSYSMDEVESDLRGMLKRPIRNRKPKAS